jgi:hypothetical protein
LEIAQGGKCLLSEEVCASFKCNFKLHESSSEGIKQGVLFGGLRDMCCVYGAILFDGIEGFSLEDFRVNLKHQLSPV